MSPITDAIRIFTHPTFHDITLKIKGGLSFGMKEGSCLPLAPTSHLSLSKVHPSNPKNYSKRYFMKYKYGDIVCCRWESTDDDAPMNILADPMIVLSFSEKYGKYQCVVTTEYSPGDDATHIDLLAEEDLKDYDDKDKDYVKEIKEIYKGIFPPNMDTRYFDVYDVTETGYRKIRGSVSRRKEGEIPVRK